MQFDSEMSLWLPVYVSSSSESCNCPLEDGQRLKFGTGLRPYFVDVSDLLLTHLKSSGVVDTENILL